MTVKEISVFIALTIQIVLLLGVYCNACTPCEENTNCEVVYTSEYDEDVGLPSSLIWKRDGVDVCTCYIGTGCLIYPQFQQEIKASIQFDAGTVTSRVTVLKATRASGLETASKWEHFAYDEESLELMHTCDLKIYKKINNATCDYQATVSGLNITCTSTNVYPESFCEFSLKIDNMYQHYDLSPVYNNTVVRKNPVYYKSVCTMEIVKEKLKPGFWEFDTTIFPDVYKNGTNCKSCNSGHIFRFNLTIEMPAVSLLNCTNVFDEGDEIVCICQREDKSDIKTSLYWEIEGTAIDNYNRSVILKEKAWKYKTGFNCFAVNMFGWLTKVNYTIVINNQTTVTEKRCTVERPNICSNQCFGVDEFCLNGKVYLCENAELDEMQEWCQTQNNAFIEAMTPNKCKRGCQSILKMRTPGERETNKTSTLVPVILCLVIICIIGVSFYVCFKFCFYKRHRPLSDASSTPLQITNDIHNSLDVENCENVNDAGIECTLFVLKKDPVKSNIFEEFTARTFKKIHLYPNQRADKCDVVLRFPDGVEHIMDDEEDFGDDRLERCESVRIVEKRSKRFRKSRARRRKRN